VFTSLSETENETSRESNVGKKKEKGQQYRVNKAGSKAVRPRKPVKTREKRKKGMEGLTKGMEGVRAGEKNRVWG